MKLGPYILTSRLKRNRSTTGLSYTLADELEPIVGPAQKYFMQPSLGSWGGWAEGIPFHTDTFILISYLLSQLNINKLNKSSVQYEFYYGFKDLTKLIFPNPFCIKFQLIEKSLLACVTFISYLPLLRIKFTLEYLKVVIVSYLSAFYFLIQPTNFLNALLWF